MEKIDLTKLEGYENQYIALSSDATKILTSAKTEAEVKQFLKANDIHDAIIEFIPPLDKLQYS